MALTPIRNVGEFRDLLDWASPSDPFHREHGVERRADLIRPGWI